MVTKRLYILPYNHRELFGKHLKNAKRDVWAGQTVIAEGFKDGAKRRYTSRLMMAIGDIVPYNYAGQAIGVYLMRQNTIKEKGVLAPEDVLEVEPFWSKKSFLLKRKGSHFPFLFSKNILIF